jgi:hypothetical protein
MQADDEELYSTDEADRRRDEVIRRMANTPPRHRTSRPVSQNQKKGRSTVADREKQKPGPPQESQE